MKNRKTIIMLILILAIGFASVTTTLVINGTIGISKNDSEFNIIFTDARLNGKTRKDFIDSETKQTITFETDKLTKINQTATLRYDVSNTSRIYDAEVSIVCNIVDNEGNTTTSEYIEMEYEPESMTLLAGDTKKGSITAKLIKGSTENHSIKVKCTLNANASERDSLGDEFIDPNKVGGTLMSRSSGNKIWADNIKNNTTKIVFENKITPHETTDDLTFDISQEQNGSIMAYAVENSESTETQKRYDLYIQSDGKMMANQYSYRYFGDFSKLTTIAGLEYFDTSNVTDMSSMFSYSGKITNLDVSSFDTSNVTDMSYMFKSCHSLTNLDLTNFDTSKVTNMSNMFSGCSGLTELKLNSFNTSKVTNMTEMFDYCEKITDFNLSNFDTSQVTNMTEMFGYCKKLTDLNLSYFDTSKVTNMSKLFLGCNSLNNLNISNFNTSQVTDMSRMFCGCSSLTNLNLSNFNTSKVEDMNVMFNGCSSLTNINISRFDTSNVTNIANMFGSCSSLTNIDLSNFDTSNVTNMSSMFSRCSNLTNINLGSFNTSKVIDMSHMFSTCTRLMNLDLRNFVTSQVTNMKYMFYNCSSLTNLDLSNFDTFQVTDMSYMFYSCENLAELNISGFDTSNVDLTTGISFLFYKMPTTANVKVKDITVQNWVLALPGDNRPSSWTTDNVIIVSPQEA